LAEAGFQADISPPTLVMGKGTLISTLDFQRLVVPLRTPLGDLQIHLALRESGESSDGAQQSGARKTGGT
jgi:chemotaxis protein CheX